MVINMKKAFATINLDAILYNYRHLVCKYHKKVIAVIKDDAYGLGKIQVSNKLKNEPDIIFAIKDIDEAIELRHANITNDLLVLGIFEKRDLDLAIHYKLTLICNSLEHLEMLKDTSIPFHLKINTGMNRLGLSIDNFNKAYEIISNNKSSYNLRGIMTHFATDDSNHKQYNLFVETLKNVDRNGLIIHCLSSNSLFEEDFTTHLRVGIKLYGFLERSSLFKSSLELYSPFIFKTAVRKGDFVGYNFKFEVEEDGFLYVLPLGYANGFGRFDKSYAYLNDTYLVQAGNISMDYTVYFSKEDIKKDTILELIGSHVPLEHLATLNRISLYQLLVNLKVDKFYL